MEMPYEDDIEAILARPPRRKTIDSWSFWKSFVQHKFLHYRAAKVVYINAPELQIPHVICLALIFLVICYHGIYQLAFLSLEAVAVPTSTIELTSLQKNFASCHHGTIDCDDMDDELTQTPNYCLNESLASFPKLASDYFFASNNFHYAKSRWTNLPLFKIRCERFDIEEAKNGVSEPYIATAITMFEQSRCTNEDCIWKNENLVTSYVKNIENYRIKIRSTVRDSAGMEYSNHDGTGFINKNGTKCFIPCDGNPKHKCNYNRPEWKNEFPACDSESHNSGCFSTGFADFISVKTILEAAGIDLNEGLCGGLPRRWWGTSLAVLIEYANAEPQDFWWSWPPGRTHLKYTISVKRMDDYAYRTELEDRKVGSRKLRMTAGLHITLNIKGRLANFKKWYYCLAKFVSFYVCFKLAGFFVDLMLLQFYKYILTSCKHVADIYSRARYSYTPSSEDVHNYLNVDDSDEESEFNDSNRARQFHPQRHHAYGPGMLQ